MPGYDPQKPQETFVGGRAVLPSVVEVISSSKRHTKLFELLQKAKLVNALNGADNITVFAPTNAALRSLSASSPAELKQMLLGHVLQYSRSPPPNHASMQTFRTLAGTKIPASKVRQFMKNGTKTRNGVLFTTNIIIR